VDLLEIDMIWYGLVRGGLHPDVDSRAFASRRIAAIKRKHEEYFNRQFIYFICTRDRVRFSTARPVRFSLFRRKLIVHLEVGPERRIVRRELPGSRFRAMDGAGRIVRPRVESSDVAITFTFPGGAKISTSVHDFLLEHGVDLGIDTRVRYVGLTKNPETRPLLRKHDGLRRVLKRIGEDQDVLFFYNTFAVRCVADEPEKGVTWWLSNAMTDEVAIRAEGLILEKLVIGYFRPDCQGALASEITELRNRFRTLSEKHRIKRIRVNLEVDHPSEYYRFFTEAAEVSPGHVFTVLEAPVDE